MARQNFFPRAAETIPSTSPLYASLPERVLNEVYVLGRQALNYCLTIFHRRKHNGGTSVL
jgi:hypothetical protein